MNDKKIIEVQGHLDLRWKEWFKGMDIIYQDNNTIISGHIQDESFLHGILNLIRDLNLKLISVNTIDKESNDLDTSCKNNKNNNSST